ncbi:SURF1 family protein [Vibrio sp. SCSIO 43136]|uniref:SURF1 family protein n=1 Tax=Vibrio sp. SCSIO 43136 TaxID=2819101 RepID=UPI002075B775|nr:SURF1 family protein [Vibrio sp. SCSIO 43136]
MFILLIKLGLWQWQRGNEKLAMESALQDRASHAPISLEQAINNKASNLTGTQIQARLTPLKQQAWLLDNQIWDSKVGYMAYQLMQDQQQNLWLFELGFVPAPNSRDQLPKLDLVGEMIEVKGRLYQRSTNPLSHDLNAESGDISRIQNLNIPQLSEQLGLTIQPWLIQPLNLTQPNYPHPWAPINMSSQKHFGYSLQWFSMAAVLLALVIAFIWRARRQDEKHH